MAVNHEDVIDDEYRTMRSPHRVSDWLNRALASPDDIVKQW